MNLSERKAETDTLPDFQHAVLERATLYRWLGHLFQRECDAGGLNWYRSEQGAAFLATLSNHPPFAAGAVRIAAAVNSGESDEDIVLRLAGSFSTLFHGVDPVRSAPPYESHYQEKDGRLFGEATVRMQKLLSRHGLVLMGFSEPADHIAVHLQLMAYFAGLLTGRDPGSPSAAELTAAQTELLAGHLDGWVEEFAADCIRFDETGFYAGAAEIMVAFLKEERRGKK